MKYMIILGFIATIPTVSAIMTNNRGVGRCMYPPKWVDGLRTCISGVSTDTLDIYVSFGQKSVTAPAKCLALCIYTEWGMFVNGRFDTTETEIFLREYIADHHLLEKIIIMFKVAANAGNAELGSNSDKAWACHTTFGTLEHGRLWNAVFRPLEDSLL